VFCCGINFISVHTVLLSTWFAFIRTGRLTSLLSRGVDILTYVASSFSPWHSFQVYLFVSSPPPPPKKKKNKNPPKGPAVGQLGRVRDF